MSSGHPTTTVPQFRTRATIAIKDIRLQGALAGATGHFRSGHDSALAELPDSDELRDHLKAIRSATLAQLADHLETFERNAQAAGVDLTMGATIGVVVSVVAASVGAPGTPGVGVVILQNIAVGAGIPLTGLSLVLGLDRPLDMARTAANVTGDLTACVLVDGDREGGEEEEEESDNTVPDA